MYYLMPAGSRFPVILIVAPAIPMLWLGSICLKARRCPVRVYVPVEVMTAVASPSLGLRAHAPVGRQDHHAMPRAAIYVGGGIGADVHERRATLWAIHREAGIRHCHLTSIS